MTPPSQVKLSSVMTHYIFRLVLDEKRDVQTLELPKGKITTKMVNETWLKLFPFLNYDILASQVIYMEVPVLETRTPENRPRGKVRIRTEFRIF